MKNVERFKTEKNLTKILSREYSFYNMNYFLAPSSNIHSKLLLLPSEYRYVLMLESNFNHYFKKLTDRL